MSRMSRRLLLVPVVLLTMAATAGASQTITLATLLQEMTDRDGLARLPDPPYTCRQASSYDRDMTEPGVASWFANWDRSQFVRTEQNEGRQEYVMMDQQGPGAVVRIWGTWHGPRGKDFSNGTLRFYLDGQSQPAIEGPVADLLSGGKLVGSPLSASVAPETPENRRAHNLYLPIPYAKSCKITYETSVPVDRGAHQGEALYYQINYRTYPADTPVQSFSMEQLKQLAPQIEQVGKRLLQSGPDESKIERHSDSSGTIKPGFSQGMTFDGPAALRSISIRLTADDLQQALRSTVLRLECDQEQTVWCPVGDFFGTGYRLSPYQTWYTRVTDDGTLRCFWTMPFEKQCQLTVHNLGNQPVEVACHVGVGPWHWDARSTHFHATWRQYTKVDTGGKKEMTGEGGARDVNFVTIDGRGSYVGDALTVFNGAPKWWGEGDEKIYVDGEDFPSHVGTGTEDYYGYAWCRPAFFNMPFHAQPEGGGNMAGGFSVNCRFRALDAIPFDKSLRFDMELWHWAATRVNYAPATFWYAQPGAACNVEIQQKAAQLPVARKIEDVAP